MRQVNIRWLSKLLLLIFVVKVVLSDEVVTDNVKGSVTNFDSHISTESAKFETQSIKPIHDASIKVSEDVIYPFREQLNLKPLANNYLLSSFSFEMNSTEYSPLKGELEMDSYDHYTVFPKTLSSIFRQRSVRELHLRFAKGFWDAESWGRLPYDGSKAGGSGLELWAVIEAESKKSAYEKWKKLANSLSGVFCASMNFICSSSTAYPILAYRPDDDQLLFDKKNGLYLIRAALADEAVCTENLTPFIRLLPTKGRSGISTLLDGHKIFDSHWHSLSIDIGTICEDENAKCFNTMEVNVDVVMNVPNTIARNENPIPKPVEGDALRCDPSKPFDAFNCFPLAESSQTSFLLSKLFGKKIQGSNIISDKPSKVCVQTTSDWNALLQLKDELFSTDDNCFELAENQSNDVYLESDNTKSIIHEEDVPIFVSRSLISYGQDRGGLRTVFQNKSDKTVKLTYFEVIPWFMKVFLSTSNVKAVNGEISDTYISNFFSSMIFKASIDRIRPSHLEYEIEVPANVTIAISYQFEKTLLKYAEYPPDANHGFEIEPAVIFVTKPIKYQTRTATLLLLLSTPDFSMPYNVIILTSTVMGLIFGTMFNLIVKKLMTFEEAEFIKSHSGPRYKLRMLKDRILSKLSPKKRD